MEHFLAFFTMLLILVVGILFFNEKVTKQSNEIVLLAFSLVVGIVLALFEKVWSFEFMEDVMKTLNTFRIDRVLLKVLLCFMMFTGASELKLPSLVHNFRAISLLAFLTTLMTSAFYGLLFWGVTALLGMKIGFTLCFLLGSIVSPTDPIAATGILNKMGLPKNVTAVMEGESLFNDGTGVALFIFIKEIYLDTKGSNFFGVMAKEVFGALFVGMLVSFAFFFLIKATKDPIKHILVSMMAVTSCYVICEHFGFSGVIASVVCGIYFSTMMDRHKARNKDLDPRDYYKDFWAIIDTLLNYILYVLIGVSFVFVGGVKYMVVIAIAAIVFNLGARYLGVLFSTWASRQCPDGYHLHPFTILMTWGGLKGGLCLALAMSAAEFLPLGAYQFILYVTYVTILFTTIVQGLTVGRVFRGINRRWPATPKPAKGHPTAGTERSAAAVAETSEYGEED